MPTPILSDLIHKETATKKFRLKMARASLLALGLLLVVAAGAVGTNAYEVCDIITSNPGYDCENHTATTPDVCADCVSTTPRKRR